MTEKLHRGDQEIPNPQYISVGKSLPGISFIWLSEDRQIIDLSNATITFSWRKFDPDLDQFTTLTPVNTPTGSSSGELQYTFDPADTANKGTYYGQFNIVYTNGDSEKVPELDGVRVNVI